MRNIVLAGLIVLINVFAVCEICSADEPKNLVLELAKARAEVTKLNQDFDKVKQEFDKLKQDIDTLRDAHVTRIAHLKAAQSFIVDMLTTLEPGVSDRPDDLAKLRDDLKRASAASAETSKQIERELLTLQNQNRQFRMERDQLIARQQEQERMILQLSSLWLGSLKSKEPAIRRWGAEGLGQVGSLARIAVPALKEALNDADNSVRAAAAEAIQKIERDQLPRPVLPGSSSTK